MAVRQVLDTLIVKEGGACASALSADTSLPCSRANDLIRLGIGVQPARRVGEGYPRLRLGLVTGPHARRERSQGLLDHVRLDATTSVVGPDRAGACRRRQLSPCPATAGVLSLPRGRASADPLRV